MSATDGKQLGKYEILAEIGRGAHATVYKARDTTLDRLVALKVMRPGLLWEPDTVERFLREAQAAAQLEHPHIATIYEVGEDQGTYYIAMRYLAGTTVEELIAQGPLPVERAVDIARQIAEALGHAHERGFVHRDVKPSNIIVDDDGVATLTDFGLVKGLAWASLSGSAGTMGTPGYAAPEIWEEQGAAPATDVYALGVVLWEMLACQRLFEGETPAGVMHKHLTARPPSLAETMTNIPSMVVDVVNRTLVKAQDDRYENGNTLAQALREAIDAAASSTGLPQPAVENKAKEQATANTSEQELTGLAQEAGMQDAVDDSDKRFQQQSVQQQPVSRQRRPDRRMILLMGLGLLSLVATLWFVIQPCGKLDLALGRSGCMFTLETHTDEVHSVTFSPDGKILAVGAGDGTVRLWRVSDGTPLRTLGAERPLVTVYSVTFSPDGQTLAVGASDGTVRLWRVSNGTPLHTLEGDYGGGYSLAFSPDGEILASGSWDNTVRLWRVSDRTLLRTLEGGRGARGVAFSPDGETLASGAEDGTVRLWRVSDGTLLRTLEGHRSAVYSLAFSPDGEILASGSRDNTVRLWRMSDRTLLRTLDLYWVRSGTVWSVGFSPDGETLASGLGDGTVRLWHVTY